jgi:hypothetical protein
MVSFVWDHLPCDGEAAERLADAVQISPVTARLLVQRGCSEPDAAHRFLHPSLDHLHDPFRLIGMAPAVGRPRSARERGGPQALHRADPRARVIRFRRNFGKAAALMAGFEQAAGSVIVTLASPIHTFSVPKKRSAFTWTNR